MIRTITPRSRERDSLSTIFAMKSSSLPVMPKSQLVFIPTGTQIHGQYEGPSRRMALCMSLVSEFDFDIVFHSEKRILVSTFYLVRSKKV